MITKNVKTRRDYLKQHSAAQGELNRHTPLLPQRADKQSVIFLVVKLVIN